MFHSDTNTTQRCQYTVANKLIKKTDEKRENKTAEKNIWKFNKMTFVH